MKKINLFLFLFFALTVKNLYSQDFEVPKNREYKVASDYAKYEKDIVEAAKWLLATPFNEQVEKRREVSAFVVEWLTGSPTVNVEINTTITDFDEQNQGMLVLFMSGCAKYVLENNYSTDMRAKHKAALRDMMTVYKAGKGIHKDKKMEKLIKSDENGKLDEWLEDNLKINPR